MFNDTATGAFGIHALAYLNPMRWSGAISFSKCIADIEKVIKENEGQRPVVVKVPANTGTSHEFKSCQEALDWLKVENPMAKLEAQKAAQRAAAEAKKQERAALAQEEQDRLAALEQEAEKEAMLQPLREQLAVLEEDEQLKSAEVDEARCVAEAKEQEMQTAKKDAHEKQHKKNRLFQSAEDGGAGGGYADPSQDPVHCEWMYAHAGGHTGFGRALAHLDPLRWSGDLGGVAAVRQLGDVRQHGSDRAIRLWHAEKNQDFETIGAAIAHIESLYPETTEAKMANLAAENAETASAAAQNNLTDAEERKKQVLQQIDECKQEIASIENA